MKGGLSYTRRWYGGQPCGGGLAEHSCHLQSSQQHTSPQDDASSQKTGGELGRVEHPHPASSSTPCYPQSQGAEVEHVCARTHVGHGHMARAEPGGRPMLSWKNLQWWKPRSHRHTHAGQFNPMVDPQRQLTKIAGDAEVARDFKVWRTLGGEFILQFDVPWSTGKQSSLENLVPNTTRRRSSAMRMIRTC